MAARYCEGKLRRGNGGAYADSHILAKAYFDLAEDVAMVAPLQSRLRMKPASIEQTSPWKRMKEDAPNGRRNSLRSC
jgi:hypothetical protein